VGLQRFLISVKTVLGYHRRMGSASLIGLISDTHGILRSEAIAALRGSDLIIHAGDIGASDILDQLRAIAPVVAVRGNIDKARWASELRKTELIEAGSAIIYVIHDIHDLDLDPAAAEIDIVVSGHSHRPDKNVRSRVLYINPGSAGPRRFKLPVTIARLNLSLKPWSVDFIDLLNCGMTT
jgi:putative phosphoesterase